MLRSVPITGGWLCVMTVTLLALPVPLFAQEIPPNDGYVTDVADIIDADDETFLEQTIAGYRAETTNEIAVVTLTNLGGRPLEEIALEIGRKWEVGSTKNNGILILVAYEEREVRIEVGYGLEGAVPDIVANGIIEMDMVPDFREGDYGGGIISAVDSLRKHIGNEYTAQRYDAPEESAFTGAGFIVGFILLQWLVAILGRTKSWWLGGVIGGAGGIGLALFFGWWLTIPILVLIGLFLDFVVSKNYTSRGRTKWWAGGGFGPGGGGGRGGGFGGFGGGSFGGGGASGRW